MYRFPTPRDPRVGAWGAPNTPKSPPPKKKIVHAFQKPRNIFEKKISREKKLRHFWPPPPPPPPIFVLHFKTPGRCFCEKKNSVTKNFHPPPPPTLPPSPQNTHLNPGAIISTPNNSCVRYGLQPPTHLINRHCQQCLYTWSSRSINVHTISNPQHNDISCIMTRSPSPHKMSRVF